jgi:hypothetical protein
MAQLKFWKKTPEASAVAVPPTTASSTTDETNPSGEKTATTTAAGDDHETSSLTRVETREERLRRIATEDLNTEHPNYPHGIKLAIILFALCCAVFLVALDQTIISTAIPKITDDFKSIQDIGWYGSSYLLTATAFQPTYGKLYTIFSVGLVCHLGVLISSRFEADR